MITISQSVGLSGKNKPVDVMLIQHLLNLNHTQAGLQRALRVTGDADKDTTDAIMSFQATSMGTKKPDGRIDPGGSTLTKLAEPVKNSDTVTTLRAVIRASLMTTLARPGEVSSTLSIINNQR